MTGRFDQEALPESVSDERLVAVLEGRAQEVGRVEAIKELGRRRSPLRTDVLLRLAAASGEPENVRTAAIVELGHQDSDAARDALVAALHSGQAPVARRAAEALGRVGDRSALAALESAAVPEGPARRSVEFAQSLLAYRLGVDAHRVPRPGDDVLLDIDGDTKPVEVRAPEPEEREHAIADLERDLPGMASSTADGLVLTCGDSTYVVVLNGELRRGESLRRLQAGPGMPAVVLKLSGGLDRFHLHAYVLTHPAGVGTLDLFVSRTTGDVTHFGSVRIEGGHATLSLRAVATPYSPPVELEGTFDEEQLGLRVERAIQGDGERARQAARQPRRIDVLAPTEP